MVNITTFVTLTREFTRTSLCPNQQGAQNGQLVSKPPLESLFTIITGSLKLRFLKLDRIIVLNKVMK